MDTVVTSSLMFILPSAIQTRIPKIPSLRRSVSKSLGYDRTPKSPSRRPGTHTPPPPYPSSEDPSSDAESLVDSDDLHNDDDPDDPSVVSSLVAPVYRASETHSGIAWKYANQGLSLLTVAFRESSSLSRDPGEGDAPFSRQLYLHGVSYLLRGLPADMSVEEELGIRSALPSRVVEPQPHLARAKQQQMILSESGDVASDSHAQRPSQPPPPQSLLHRMLATCVLQLFFFLHTLLPYVRLMASAVYRYERQHRVAERAFASGLATIDGLGRRGIEMSNAVYAMNDGKVGRAVNEAMVWWISGVGGGLFEGVQRGMAVWGVRVERGEGGGRQKA